MSNTEQTQPAEEKKTLMTEMREGLSKAGKAAAQIGKIHVASFVAGTRDLAVGAAKDTVTGLRKTVNGASILSINAQEYRANAERRSQEATARINQADKYNLAQYEEIFSKKKEEENVQEKSVMDKVTGFFKTSQA